MTTRTPRIALAAALSLVAFAVASAQSRGGGMVGNRGYISAVAARVRGARLRADPVQDRLAERAVAAGHRADRGGEGGGAAQPHDPAGRAPSWYSNALELPV
jgi:hypothetical protein